MVERNAIGHPIRGLHYPTQTMIKPQRQAHEVKERTPEKLSGFVGISVLSAHRGAVFHGDGVRLTVRPIESGK